MAGNFDPSSTTFMQRHKAGLNSTGMYIISGIPFLRDLSGDNTDPFPLVFPSLTRDVTITLSVGKLTFHFDGFVQNANGAWGQTKPDGTAFNASFNGPGDAAADAAADPAQAAHSATNEFKLDATNGPVSVTLPVRVKGMLVTINADSTVASLCANLIGTDHPAYPRLPGDGTMLLNPNAQGYPNP